VLTSRTFTLNDPLFPTNDWGSNNLGQPNSFLAAGGKYGMDMDMPAAWSVTTGSMTTVVALLDDGVDYTNDDGASTDTVFRSSLGGSLIGSWTIDPANTHPTGITLNPNMVGDLWIVDSGTLKVYQYAGATWRTGGSQTAAATFALAASDTNPQDIGDPPPNMLLTPAPAAALRTLPPVAALNVVSTNWPSAVAAIPSLVSRDMVFSLLMRESLPGSGQPTFNHLASGALLAQLDGPTGIADQAWTAAGPVGGQQPLDPLTPLPPAGSPAFGADHSAVEQLEGAWIDDDTQSSTVATDAFFAVLAEDTVAEVGSNPPLAREE
jgi:hypothetical protein